jgi:hypothetical protein
MFLWLPVSQGFITLGFRPVIFIAGVLLLARLTATAQQPFYTDDADVTDKKQFHLQISNEYDLLQRAAYPSLRQNTAVFELDYGLLSKVEVGVDGPLIAILNSHVAKPKSIFGFGDLDFHVKYNFLKEREGSWHPALTVAFNVEVPTGDEKKQLGSGLVDYFFNGILQKSLTKKTKLRLNGGILLAGNDTTGEIGIKGRGTVFVGGGSLVKQITPKLDLGVELTGAVGGNLRLQQGQLQILVGGNYQVTKKMSFDFGIVGGKFNSPRAGVQLGVSIDFGRSKKERRSVTER